MDIVTNALGSYSFTGLCPSVFTLEIDQNGTLELLVFNVGGGAINPGPSIQIDICSTNGNSNLAGYIPGLAAGGTWTDPQGNTHNATFNPSSDEPGLYTYTIQSGGCDVSTGVLVELIQNADPGDYVNYLICEDYVPFLMTDWMDDPNGEWFDEFGNPVSGWFDPATMNTATFVYMIDTVIGCPPVFASMTVTENQIPDAGVDATVLVCSNGVPFDMTDYLGGNPQTNGQWFDPFNNQVSDIFDPNSMDEGVYRYKVDGQAPCDDVNAFLTINFTDTNPSGESATIHLCSNSNAVNMFNQLEGTPLAGGTWTNSSNQVVDNIFNPANELAGVFTYYYPNVGCSPGNSQLTITVEALQNAGQNNSVTVCESVNSVNLSNYLSVGTSPNGVWTNSNNNPITPNITLAGPTTQTYTYSVNGTYCPDDESEIILVVEGETPPPGNTQLTLCSESDPIDLNDLYSLNDLEFQDGLGNSISNIFDPSMNSTQELIVISPSQNSCPDGISVIDIEIENPSFTDDTVSAEVCNSALVFDLNSTNNQINFNNGNWFNASDVIIDPLIDLVGEFQVSYHFESTDQTVCESSVFVVELATFEPNEAGPNNEVVFCTSDDEVLLTTLLPIAAGGLGQWTFDNENYIDDSIDPETSSSGVYAYTIPANGPCPADVAYLEVFIQNGFEYSAGPDVEICQGEPPVTIGQDNPPGCTFSWSPFQDLSTPNNYQTDVSVGNTLNVPVTFEYEITVFNGVCVVTDTVLVIVNPLPQPNLANEYSICVGEEVVLNSGATGSFNWESEIVLDDPQASIQVISPLDTTSISLTVENQWGCIAMDSTVINTHPIPYFVFSMEAVEGCSPLPWTFELDTAYTDCEQIIWDFGPLGIYEGWSVESFATENGVYNCQVTTISPFGCTYTANPGNLIEVFPAPSAGFDWEPTTPTTIDPIVTFTDESQDAMTYYWNFAGIDTSNLVSPLFEFPADVPGNYEVCQTVWNEYNCQSTHCEIIHLENEYIFYAPNTFTPDNDGINDVFAPVVMGFDNSTYELIIFNRWGDAVFTTQHIWQPWTGNVHGGDHYAEDGTYVWQVRIKDKENAEYRVFRGHLNLLR